jgi:hypothetical protein
MSLQSCCFLAPNLEILLSGWDFQHVLQRIHFFVSIFCSYSLFGTSGTSSSIGPDFLVDGILPVSSMDEIRFLTLARGKYGVFMDGFSRSFLWIENFWMTFLPVSPMGVFRLFTGFWAYDMVFLFFGGHSRDPFL